MGTDAVSDDQVSALDLDAQAVPVGDNDMVGSSWVRSKISLKSFVGGSSLTSSGDITSLSRDLVPRKYQPEQK